MVKLNRRLILIITFLFSLLFYLTDCLAINQNQMQQEDTIMTPKKEKEMDNDILIKKTGILYVRDFGAVGDGKNDDTKAIQSALYKAGELGGGIVELGIGEYLCKGHLDIPENVTLRGVWRSPVAWREKKGSILLVVEGKGDPDGIPFITMHRNSTLEGLTIFYPEQDPDNIQPYPWTVRGDGENISIINVLMVNPYQAVDFGTYSCHRHYINGLYAHALYRGIFVDKCMDIGRIENVHLWPFWMTDERLYNFTKTHGEAFIFGKTDWQYVSNCFAILYKIGFHFISNKEYGPGNVVLTQSGADVGPCAVLVEDSQLHAGISFINSQFMAGIVVDSTNQGPVKFTACGFWGVQDLTEEHAVLKGQGNVTFNGCHFISWDTKKQGKYAIDADCAGLTVIGCEFLEKGKNHIILRKNVKSAIITSNRFRDKIRIKNESKIKPQIGFNTAE